MVLAIVNTQFDNPDLVPNYLRFRLATYCEIDKNTVVFFLRDHSSLLPCRFILALLAGNELKVLSRTAVEVDFLAIDIIVSGDNIEVLYAVCVWIVCG